MKYNVIKISSKKLHHLYSLKNIILNLLYIHKCFLFLIFFQIIAETSIFEHIIYA